MNLACKIGVIAALTLMLFASSAPATELITNGNFEGGFFTVAPHRVPTSWSLWETTPNPTETSLAFDINWNGPSAPGITAWEFFRNDFNLQTGDWTSIEQSLNILVASYDTLALSIDVVVDNHDLEAGGFVVPAFEWPAIVQVDYTDLTDQPQIWRFGWYVDPPGDFVFGAVADPGQGLIPIYNDLLVPPNVWVTSTFDLLVELPQAKTIDKIRVGGSGWSFHSMMDNVSLNGVLGPTYVDSRSWAGVKGLYR